MHNTILYVVSFTSSNRSKKNTTKYCKTNFREVATHSTAGVAGKKLVRYCDYTASNTQLNNLKIDERSIPILDCFQNRTLMKLDSIDNSVYPKYSCLQWELLVLRAK